ncbi:MAG: DUF4065 domain-containing protein [Sterolibacterium sp.]|nr:DUF4065 domain-containing protein [Sterolibacterium sp.]
MSHAQYTAPQLADYLLKKAHQHTGANLNLMKLGSLVYYAEAWSLAVFDRELVNEELQAWDHGPVFPSLWEKLSSKGWNALTANELDDCATTLDEDTRGLLDDVWQAYGEFSQTELGKMIKQDGPWKAARRGLPDWDLSKRPIKRDGMAQFYKAAFETAEQAPTPQVDKPTQAPRLVQSY